MIKHTEYIHYHQTGSVSSETERSDEEIEAEGWWCRACRKPFPNAGAIDFTIATEVPSISPLDSVFGFGVRMAKLDFLIAFGAKNVANDLMLGKVFGPSGNPISGWVTFRGKYRVTIRRTKGADYTGPGHKYCGYRHCKNCGRLLYHALGSPYLSPAPDSNAMILETYAGIAVPKALADDLPFKRKRGFGIETLKVHSVPKDGYGDLT